MVGEVVCNVARGDRWLCDRRTRVIGDHVTGGYLAQSGMVGGHVSLKIFPHFKAQSKAIEERGGTSFISFILFL